MPIRRRSVTNAQMKTAATANNIGTMVAKDKCSTYLKTLMLTDLLREYLGGSVSTLKTSILSADFVPADKHVSHNRVSLNFTRANVVASSTEISLRNGFSSPQLKHFVLQTNRNRSIALRIIPLRFPK
jgi:hypothetical protein